MSILPLDEVRERLEMLGFYDVPDHVLEEFCLDLSRVDSVAEWNDHRQQNSSSLVGLSATGRERHIVSPPVSPPPYSSSSSSRRPLRNDDDYSGNRSSRAGNGTARSPRSPLRTSTLGRGESLRGSSAAAGAGGAGGAGAASGAYEMVTRGGRRPAYMVDVASPDERGSQRRRRASGDDDDDDLSDHDDRQRQPPSVRRTRTVTWNDQLSDEEELDAELARNLRRVQASRRAVATSVGPTYAERSATFREAEEDYEHFQHTLGAASAAHSSGQWYPEDSSSYPASTFRGNAWEGEAEDDARRHPHHSASARRRGTSSHQSMHSSSTRRKLGGAGYSSSGHRYGSTSSLRGRKHDPVARYHELNRGWQNDRFLQAQENGRRIRVVYPEPWE